jgi:PTS system glucitol/sorbitol-specific IIC component
VTSADSNTDDNLSGPFRSVFVRAGRNGWGQGLLLTPTNERHKVISVTGGGIHPVAQRIADLSGAVAIDGFRSHVADDEVLAAVINCGGTARIGVYPRKRIPTVDVFPGEPGGPLAQFITEDIFVSAVGVDDVSLQDEQVVGSGAATVREAASGTRGGTDAGVGSRAHRPPESAAEGGPAAGPLPPPPQPATPATAPRGFFVKFGTGIGYIINTFLAAGRQAINLTLNTVLPFMAYVSLLLGFVLYTGVATAIGNLLAPLSSNPLGLIAIGAVVALPFLSPILGPGAAVAQIVGVLMGTQIATGTLPVQYALPTLFAIDGQVGCDFIPVGLGLGEAKAETVEVGTPAVLFSRVITSPLAVVIAWFASFGL